MDLCGLEVYILFSSVNLFKSKNTELSMNGELSAYSVNQWFIFLLVQHKEIYGYKVYDLSFMQGGLAEGFSAVADVNNTRRFANSSRQHTFVSSPYIMLFRNSFRNNNHSPWCPTEIRRRNLQMPFVSNLFDTVTLICIHLFGGISQHCSGRLIHEFLQFMYIHIIFGPLVYKFELTMNFSYEFFWLNFSILS